MFNNIKKLVIILPLAINNIANSMENTINTCNICTNENGNVLTNETSNLLNNENSNVLTNKINTNHRDTNNEKMFTLIYDKDYENNPNNTKKYLNPTIILKDKRELHSLKTWLGKTSKTSLLADNMRDFNILYHNKFFTGNKYKNAKNTVQLFPWINSFDNCKELDTDLNSCLNVEQLIGILSLSKTASVISMPNNKSILAITRYSDRYENIDTNNCWNQPNNVSYLRKIDLIRNDKNSVFFVNKNHKLINLYKGVLKYPYQYDLEEENDYANIAPSTFRKFLDTAYLCSTYKLPLTFTYSNTGRKKKIKSSNINNNNVNNDKINDNNINNNNIDDDNINDNNINDNNINDNNINDNNINNNNINDDNINDNNINDNNMNDDNINDNNINDNNINDNNINNSNINNINVNNNNTNYKNIDKKEYKNPYLITKQDFKALCNVIMKNFINGFFNFCQVVFESHSYSDIINKSRCYKWLFNKIFLEKYDEQKLIELFGKNCIKNLAYIFYKLIYSSDKYDHFKNIIEDFNFFEDYINNNNNNNNNNNKVNEIYDINKIFSNETKNIINYIKNKIDDYDGDKIIDTNFKEIVDLVFNKDITDILKDFENEYKIYYFNSGKESLDKKRETLSEYFDRGDGKLILKNIQEYLNNLILSQSKVYFFHDILQSIGQFEINLHNIDVLLKLQKIKNLKKSTDNNQDSLYEIVNAKVFNTILPKALYYSIAKYCNYDDIYYNLFSNNDKIILIVNDLDSHFEFVPIKQEQFNNKVLVLSKGNNNLRNNKIRIEIDHNDLNNNLDNNLNNKIKIENKKYKKQINYKKHDKNTQLNNRYNNECKNNQNQKEFSSINLQSNITQKNKNTLLNKKVKRNTFNK